MSITVPKKFHIRLHRWFVKYLAKGITKSLGCETIIAGSYRRGKRFCNDIDIVIVSDMSNEDIDLRMANAGWRMHAYGIRKSADVVRRQYFKRYKLFNIIKYIVVDIMPANTDNLGNVLLFATGSRHHNDKIRKYLSSIGWTWKNPRMFANLATNERVSFKSELEVYKHLGKPYLKPEERHV